MQQLLHSHRRAAVPQQQPRHGRLLVRARAAAVTAKQARRSAKVSQTQVGATRIVGHTRGRAANPGARCTARPPEQLGRAGHKLYQQLAGA